MHIQLPTTIEVKIDDVDLLTILKKKKDELLEGAEYAEPNEENNEYWLWKSDASSIRKPDYKKWKEISQVKYEFLDSLTNTIYRLQKELESRKFSGNE